MAKIGICSTVQNVIEQNAKTELERREVAANDIAACSAKSSTQQTPKPWKYLEEVRQKAIPIYVDGMNLRRVARQLGIHHRTVSLWVKACAAQLPDPPVSDKVKE